MAATAVSAPAPVPPAPASSNMVASDVAPSQTLYLNNLNEKLKKGALKKGLYAVFTQFGPVMDIVACRTNRLRGQAWVVFENVADATNALRQMQGFPFFDKPMVRGPVALSLRCSGTVQGGWRPSNFRRSPGHLHARAAPPPRRTAHSIRQGEVRRGGQVGRHLCAAPEARLGR